MKLFSLCGHALLWATLTGATPVSADEEHDMNRLASALTKLSSAVEATVKFKHPSPLLSSRELLLLSTVHDTKLLTRFAPYEVLVYRNKDVVTLLVCERKRDRALLEDQACTARMDQHHWRSSAMTMCAFTLMDYGQCAR